MKSQILYPTGRVNTIKEAERCMVIRPDRSPHPVNEPCYTHGDSSWSHALECWREYISELYGDEAVGEIEVGKDGIEYFNFDYKVDLDVVQIEDITIEGE
jgi:hypothetical protein